MTDAFVKEQVKAIEEATKEALRSRESAIRFLQEAGILKNETNADHSTASGYQKNSKKR